MLENTYIRYASSRAGIKPQNVHLTTTDLERSDMGCLKRSLHSLMV